MAEPLMSLSPGQQIRFAQEKLRQMHKDICVLLSPYKDLIQLLQEIVLCKKIAISATLFCLVQLFFWHLYTNNNTYITVISDVVFWVLLADVFWVVATRDRRRGPPQPESTNNNERARRRQQELKLMSLEETIIKDVTPLQVGELPPFEVVCLWLAKVMMHADNVLLALQHWSQMNPYLFSIVTGTFGLFCIVIGYFFSGVFLMFLIVNFLLLYPSFCYYDLISRANAFIDTHYPVVSQKVVGTYRYIKSILSPLEDREFTGIHLDPNRPMEDELPETPKDQQDSGARPETNTSTENEDESEANRQHGLNRDVSMTLTPFDVNIDPLQSLASLTVPPGGFPSITSFFNEDSISLTPFPSSTTPVSQHQTQTSTQPQRESSKRNVHQLPNITERDESLSLEPFEHIDPIKDSFDDNFYEPLDSTEPKISEIDSGPSPIPSAPLEPPPPYLDSSPYFSSPLLTSFRVPTSSSTPAADSERDHDETSQLRKRDKI